MELDLLEPTQAIALAEPHLLAPVVFLNLVQQISEQCAIPTHREATVAGQDR